jgi:hypothetical protein
VAPASSGWIDTNVVDGNQYLYIVYADNGLYCTPTVSGAVESKRPPGPANGSIAVAHSGGGFHDLAITSLGVASGTAVRYEYSLGDGVWHGATVGAFITPPGSLYGSTLNVEFRGCRDASANYCGDPSAVYSATPMATRAAVVTCDRGSPPTFAGPMNPGSTTATVTYEVAYRNLGLIWSGFSYSPSDDVPPFANGIRVKATVVDGPNSHTDPGYGEFSCPN